MRKIREILRLRYEHGCNHREIGPSVGASPSTVGSYLRHAKMAGLTMPWVDKKTGVIHQAQIFVAVLGASNYTYVEATEEQSLRHWINSHIHAFEFFNGVPTCLVPDNLKAGITKPHLYDPDTNVTYQEMANHYNLAIIPARVRTPKDKPKVEVGVQGIQRWVLAPLRD